MLDDDCKAFKRLAKCGDRSVSSNTKVDVQFRQTAVDPAPAVLIRLQASAYERNRKTQRVLLLIAFGTAISKIVLVLLAREPGPTLLDPLLGVMAFGVYLLARFHGSIAPTLKLIDRTLHRLDKRGEVVESIADLRGEVQPVRWGFTSRGEPYSGHALVLRFPSGPFVVGLDPAPGALEGTRVEAPSWMISQEDYDLLVRSAQP